MLSDFFSLQHVSMPAINGKESYEGAAPSHCKAGESLKGGRYQGGVLLWLHAARGHFDITSVSTVLLVCAPPKTFSTESGRCFQATWI